VYEFLASRSEDPIELTLEEVRQGTMLSKVSAEAVGTAETLLAKTGVLQRLESGGGYATLRIDSKLPTLVDMLPREARVRRKVLQQCERIVGTRRGEDVPFRLDRLIERLEMERESVLRSLRELSRLQDFDFVPPFRGRAVHFRRRGVPFRELQIDFRELDRRKAAEYEKLESVLRLCRTTACRQRTILDYFGDQRAANCGVCDNCVQHGSVRTTSSPIESPDTDTKRPAVILQTASQFSPHREDSAAIRAIGVAVLQAVARTHGRIGKLLTAQVLVGSQSQKLQGLRLHRTADFGRFKGLRQSEITQVLDQLLHTGLLEQREVNQHRPTLYITEAGQAILKEPERLAGMIRLPPPLVARASAALNAGSPEKSPSVGSQPSAGDSPKHAPATESADPSPQPGADQTKNFADLPTRVAALRRWRRETADQVGIPAYRVLPSNLVEELAARSPQSLEALERIPGLAPEIISQWGAEILEVLHAPSGLISQSVARTMDPAAVEPEAEPAHGSADSSAVAARCDAPQLPRVREPVRVGHEVLKAEESAGSWTGKLLADGYKWMEMLQARRLTPEAALADLETLADAGQPLDVQRLPTEAELRASLNDQVRSPPDVESLCQRLERLRQAGRTPPADGPERSGGPGRPSMVRQVSP
jgi:ATP-dependent DNA helicase RecQ